MCRLVVVLALVVTAIVHAQDEHSPQIELRDFAGTGATWHEAAAIIPASPERIRRWLTDYQSWPSLFPDIEWSQPLADDEQGRHVVRFRSRIADAELTLHEAVMPFLLLFEATSPVTVTQGRIHLIDLGDGRTRVLMQSTIEVHGIARMVATHERKRDRAYQVSTSHLTALWNLAR